VGTDCIAGQYQSVAPATRFHAIEVKRNVNIDAVEQLTRYLTYLDRDPLLNPPVQGWLVGQTVTPQARTLGEDRGFICRTVDYDELRGLDDPESRLF
jgi:RecB family endonuclease NucS